MGFPTANPNSPLQFGCTMSVKEIVQRLETTHPQIKEIMNIAGTAGLSIGVLHHGKPVHRANFGYRDVATRVAPDGDTIYRIGSMTKGMVATAFAMLVEDGRIRWDTSLHEVVPEFRSPDARVKLEQLKTEADITDLFSHRLGVAGRNQYWTQMHQKMLLGRKLTATVLSDLDPVIGFRKTMFYNNWGYGLLGEILEGIVGETIGEFLMRTVFNPLGLTRTTLGIPYGENCASSYIALTDGTPYHIPPPRLDDRNVIVSAGGAKSTVTDLLLYYKSMMEAAHHQNLTCSASTPALPFARVGDVWTERIPITEGSGYGLGWVLAELPSKAGLTGVNAYPMYLGYDGMPVIVKGASPNIRVVYHNGSMIGALSSVYLLPDTQTAIVVLSNTLGLCDAADWIGQLLLEALIGTTSPVDFVAYAKKSRMAQLAIHPATNKRLKEERVLNTKHKPMSAYAGRYCNKKGYFFLDVTECMDGLRMTVQGLPEVHYDLYHYNYDVFAWDCDRDEDSKKCTYPQASIGWHKVVFETGDDGRVQSILWAYDAAVPAGERFFKEER